MIAINSLAIVLGFLLIKLTISLAKVLIPATLVKITPDSQGFLVSNPDLTLRLLTDISDELANAESRLAHISYDKSLNVFMML